MRKIITLILVGATIAMLCAGSANAGGKKGSGSSAGKVTFNPFSITKHVDKATADLLYACASGKHLKKGTLYVRKAGEKPLEYLTVELEDIIVSHVSMGGSGSEDRLTENVTLNFATFHVKYAVQSKDGSKGAETEHKWHIHKNVAG